MSKSKALHAGAAKAVDRELITNDVVICIATANGTGSQSANLILMRSIFRMGVPVGAKNLFPSNIQGLPTWFTVRANKDGWTGARTEIDIMVCMNPESASEDIQALAPGAVLLIDEHIKHFLTRDDLLVYTVPFKKLVEQACPVTKLRRLVVNMIYVGVLASLLDIDLSCVEAAIGKQFGGKQKAIDVNKVAMKAGHAWAGANLVKHDPYRIERMDKTRDKVIMDANTACAIGFMYGGVQVIGWYPITPSSGLCESLIAYLKKYRRDPETQKATYGVIQAEDELASIGIVCGAGWAGARAMTATSGPGISLMAEIAGLCYMAEIPATIAVVQRMGPSTGLPTRTSQGDIAKAYYLSHGDAKHLMLIPGNLQECFEFSMEALNAADRFQTLVFLMIDLDLGMNNWMTDPLTLSGDIPIDRGKVLSADDLKKLEKFERYKDLDGDGIPYRTIPGTDSPGAAYFTRGTGHDTAAKYSEKPAIWKSNIDRLAKKHETARSGLPQPVVDLRHGAKVGLLAYGSSDLPVQEARNILQEAEGLKTDYMRIRALPFSPEVKKFLERHEMNFFVEQNRDAQMASILLTEMPQFCGRLHSVLHYSGDPLDARSVVEPILEHQHNARS